jgi:HD-GYP domain-containing protein (c-di-GMP phosphodiesterase class II)
MFRFSRCSFSTYHAYSLGIALILFVPTLAAQRLLHLYQQEKEATRHLAAVNSTLRTANTRFMTGLVAVYEESDPYTAKHSLVVATYARDIAKRMGLSADDCDLVHLCGLVHDIGNAGSHGKSSRRTGRSPWRSAGSSRSIRNGESS